MPPTARNLCLHYVAPSGHTRRLAITPDALRDAVARLTAEGLSPAALGDYRQGPVSASRFTLSFDDAHRSVLTHAAPVLRALDVPATLFVATAWVGASDEFLTWDELRALRDLGWSLGAHSVTHPRMSWRLYDESPERYAARLDDECARAREALSRELDVDVDLFAYPYGEHPPAAREAVRRAGYRAAFTVSDGLAWSGDPLTIPRVDGQEDLGHVAVTSGAPTGISVVVPACDRVEVLGEVLRRLARQSYPRDRHEVIVVDDGSRHDLSPALAELPSARVIHRAGEVGVFGAGAARQRGADAARFDTLAFLDADVAVGRDHLWHLDWIHRRVPGAVVLGYLSGYNLHDQGHAHTVAQVRHLDDLDGAVAIIPDRSREPTLRACLDNLDWLDEPWRLAYTGNLSLPRALLDRIGGFAREFTGWGLEDLDLGYRLHRAGARWVFGRFAVGYHLTDPGEDAPRNPFRHPSPTRERFAGYLANLDTLLRRHGDDPAVARFHAQSRSDVDETCGRPHTVGIEVGGASPLAPAYHRALHRVAPGGVPTAELLDRAAYARKVGARQVYILGGEPAAHPGFLPLLRAVADAGVRWTTVQTTAVPFADASLARAAREAGMRHAVVEVYGFDPAVFGRATRRPQHHGDFVAGLASLAAAGMHRTARVVVADDTVDALADTARRLADLGVAIDEVVAVGAQHEAAARELAGPAVTVRVTGVGV